MPATLRVIPSCGKPFDVGIGNSATIGRLPESSVCLSCAPSASRQHAVIRSHNGCDYQLIDLGTLNGTFVNGQRVVLPVALENSSRIRIAGNGILFELATQESEDCKKSTLPGSSPGSGYMTISVALMVCDVRRSSAAAEVLSKGDFARCLGGWFRQAGNLTEQGNGNIDKFIGDAFFVYWTQLESQQAECDAAFHTGCQLTELARTMTWPHTREPLEIAVALHYGSVTCLNIGVLPARDVSIIGDAVNTVFRLESLAKELGQQILASQDFVASLGSPEGFTDLGEQTLKGKRHPLRVFGFNRDRPR